jgi:phosphoenolpyruvate carboxylase
MRRVQSAADKDAPLRYDIRLLGRILGETIRAQEEERTFDIIERIRLTALRFHRDADASAGRDLQTIIKGIGNREAIRIIRAFGYRVSCKNGAYSAFHIDPWSVVAAALRSGRRRAGEPWQH